MYLHFLGLNQAQSSYHRRIPASYLHAPPDTLRSFLFPFALKVRTRGDHLVWRNMSDRSELERILSLRKAPNARWVNAGKFTKISNNDLKDKFYYGIPEQEICYLRSWGCTIQHEQRGASESSPMLLASALWQDKKGLEQIYHGRKIQSALSIPIEFSTHVLCDTAGHRMSPLLRSSISWFPR